MGNKKNIQQVKDRIEEMEKELQNLKEKIKNTNENNEDYVPKKGMWVIYGYASVELEEEVIAKDYWNIGRAFGTKEEATKARDIMVAHDIILKYVFDHAPLYKPNWNNNTDKYYVNLDHSAGIWHYNCVINSQHFEPYMPKWVAEKLVDDLNKGKINLYPF